MSATGHFTAAVLPALHTSAATSSAGILLVIAAVIVVAAITAVTVSVIVLRRVSTLHREHTALWLASDVFGGAR